MKMSCCRGEKGSGRLMRPSPANASKLELLVVALLIITTLST